MTGTAAASLDARKELDPMPANKLAHHGIRWWRLAMAGEEESRAMRNLLYLGKDETIAGMDQTAKEGNGVTRDL